MIDTSISVMHNLDEMLSDIIPYEERLWADIRSRADSLPPYEWVVRENGRKAENRSIRIRIRIREIHFRERGNNDA